MLEQTLISERPAHEIRRHRRVPLVLMVRLRWVGALGLETEVSETRDTSRGGLLTTSRETRRTGAPVWITFPYRPEEKITAPEFPARVAHTHETSHGEHLVGVAFDSSRGDCSKEPHAEDRRSGSFWRRARRVLLRSQQRRRSERIAMALPLAIRRKISPWPDETISVNVSNGGVVFTTLQMYEPGEEIKVELPENRWVENRARFAKVLRISERSGTLLQNVAAQFIS
jgi:PilZ domain